MGKKSRRQRTKKVLNLDPKGAPPAAITPHGNLAPEQLRVFGNELLDSQKYWTHDDDWPRVRRRICWGCGKEYDLSEPRLWVCGGCGEARYCDEACQSAHWPEHKTPCLKTFHEKTKKSLSRGVSVEKLRQAYLEAYHDDGAARVFSAMDKK